MLPIEAARDLFVYGIPDISIALQVRMELCGMNERKGIQLTVHSEQTRLRLEDKFLLS